MIVMKEHNWFDEDVERITRTPVIGYLTISLSTKRELEINKQDVMALAKEFNLLVYEKDSQL